MSGLLVPFQYAFMQRAFVAALAVGLLCSVMGTYVVLRKLSFIGDGIAHASFAGIVIAYIRGLDYYVGAAVVAVLTALGIGFVHRRGNISLDTTARAVQVDGDSLELTRREIAVLETLMRHRTRPVAKRALEEAVYSFAEDVTPNAIEAAVSRVRRRLDGAGARVTISAARGMGYLLSERSI